MAAGDLVSICRILNEKGVKYAVAGAHACALHGHIRATEDYDILVDSEPGNIERLLSAISEIFPDFPHAITAADILNNVVLKISDHIEMDVSIQAWTVDYQEAARDLEHVIVDGVRIPYLGLAALIKSKSTNREIDQWDVKILTEIAKRRLQKP